jgi:hypothetical protein
MPRRRRQRRDRRGIEAPVLLACEGSDDCYFLDTLRGLLNVDDSLLQIEAFGPDEAEGGKDWLPEYLSALETRDGFGTLRALGIVRDADTNAAAALTSVFSHLVRNSFVSQSTVPAHGRVFPGVHQNGRGLQVSVFIMPDGASTGAWEDLYLEAVREYGAQTGDTGLSCADEFVACIDSDRSLQEARREKTRLYAWLCSRERPGVRPGQALLWGYLDFQVTALRPIRQFIQDLTRVAGAPDRGSI